MSEHRYAAACQGHHFDSAKHHATVTTQYVNPRLTATVRFPMPPSIQALNQGK